MVAAGGRAHIVDGSVQTCGLPYSSRRDKRSPGDGSVVCVITSTEVRVRERVLLTELGAPDAA
jgi:hypothetical protein